MKMTTKEKLAMITEIIAEWQAGFYVSYETALQNIAAVLAK